MSDELDERPRGATLEEIRERCLHWKADGQGRRVVAGSAYNRLLLRRISVHVTRYFLKLGIGANTATWMMIVAGLVGIVCCVPHSIVATIGGAIAFALFDVFDAVDGEIARWHRSCSTKGLYLDKVGHLLVGYPSLGLPALHYYGMYHGDLYLALAAAAIICGLMGYTLREIFFRINAEAIREDTRSESADPSSNDRSQSLLVNLCGWLKSGAITSFPITKARVVHILTICAILASYRKVEGPLVFLAWFYAGYGALRLSLEIPYFYHKRVIDVPHEKQINDYRWPI